MEYLMIIGFSMIVAMLLLVLYQEYGISSRDQIGNAQVERIGNDLVYMAEEVYYSGVPARRTVRVYIPETVEDITITSNGIIFILNQGRSEMEFYTPVNLTGNFEEPDGPVIIEIIAQEEGACIRQEGQSC